jgi:AAA+ ATPase superfamily predicted ATPase
MKFYNREKELELLESTWNLSKTGAKMTIVTGRRRIGKTSLILKAVEDKPFVYFFASKKSEKLLCEEYINPTCDLIP